MGYISINELNEDLQLYITNGALDDAAYTTLSNQADINIQKLTISAAAVSRTINEIQEPEEE